MQCDGWGFRMPHVRAFFGNILLCKNCILNRGNYDESKKDHRDTDRDPVCCVHICRIPGNVRTGI